MALLTVLKCVGLAIMAALAVTFTLVGTYTVIVIIKELKNGEE